MTEDTDLDAAFADEAEDVQLDPTGLLSNDEVLQARAQARASVLAERKLKAMAEIEKAETERLRIEEGFVTGIGAMDEIVNITIDLAPYTEKISINGPLGQHYYNGRTYPVPRHVANSLVEQMHRSWRHEDQVDGKNLTQTYARKRDTAINARTSAVSNAPRPFNA